MNMEFFADATRRGGVQVIDINRTPDTFDDRSVTSITPVPGTNA
jgi:hypothetical protein